MKFVVVNHRTPYHGSICRHCCEPLGVGYLRDVSTQWPYCNYECYRRSEGSRVLAPWFAAMGTVPEPVTGHPFSLGMLASLAVAACWGYAIPLSAVTISLAQAALGLHDLMTPERVPVRRPG